MLKKELAHQIVSELHDKKLADKAQENFEKTIQHKKMPEEIQVFTFDIPELNIIDVLIQTKLSSSKSDAKRLIEQGGVWLDGNTISAPNEIEN